MKVGDGSLGSHEAEGVGGEGFYITQSGRRVDLHVSGRGPEVSPSSQGHAQPRFRRAHPQPRSKRRGAQVDNLNWNGGEKNSYCILWGYSDKHLTYFTRRKENIDARPHNLQSTLESWVRKDTNSDGLLNPAPFNIAMNSLAKDLVALEVRRTILLVPEV